MASRRSFAYSRLLIQSFNIQFTRSNRLRISNTRNYVSENNPTFKGAEVKDSTPANQSALDLEGILAKPTWSVRSLLPPKSQQSNVPKISSQQLHHLLRLSALPLPESPEEETKMLETLSAQLHFVGEIQQVNTEGIAPLRAIRDETLAAEKDQTITLETLKDALAKEEVVGKHHKRIRRKTDRIDAKEAEDWDILGSAERKVGKYFVVESERP